MAKSIKDIIYKINHNEYLIPSIQREYRWDTSQIEKLFDSIMKGYPINSFLFWKMKEENLSTFELYSFTRKFEKNVTQNINNVIKINNNESNNIIGVLDGQQRLTSLYIGLKGSYVNEKGKELKLYLDLLQSNKSSNIEEEVDDIENNLSYKFKFLEPSKAISNEEHYWFYVGDILDMRTAGECISYLMNKGLGTNENALNVLTNLWSRINREEIINYFCIEEDKDLDEVLEIFVRINKGGTPLSYSDFEMSYISTKWKDKNIKEEFKNLNQQIEELGFELKNNDILLIIGLVLINSKNISVAQLSKFIQVIPEMEKEWDNISKAIVKAFELMKSYGFSGKVNNSIIAIAHYIYIKSKEKSSDFVTAMCYKQDRDNIRKFVSCAIISNYYSGSSQSTVINVRNIIRDNHNTFPIEEILKHEKFMFTEEKIDKILDKCKYHGVNTQSILLLLYPNIDTVNGTTKVTQDHIYPQDAFKKANLKKKNLQDNDFYNDKNKNNICNLQLLTASENSSKNNTPFKDWLEEKFKNNPNELEKYKRENYIPDVPLDFEHFEEFYNERKKLLKEALKDILMIKTVV